MSPSTSEVSFTETSLFNITQSGAFPFLKQLLYYPVGTCHHFVHSIKNSTQRGFVSCIFQCSKCWKITGLSPHNVARGTLFPKQFASIYSFLMKSFIQCIYSINSLQVIGKISRCIASPSGCTSRKSLQELISNVADIAKNNIFFS